MLQENVEVVRRGYESLARRDSDALEALGRQHMAPDFEFESVLTGQTYKRPRAMRDLAADLWETLDYIPAAEEIIGVGERVVVVLRIAGRGMRSGVPVSQQVAIVYTFDDDLLVRGKSFTSRAEALEAAGLSD